MKNMQFMLGFILVFLFNSNHLFAQNQEGNAERIADRAEAKRLYDNFRTHYPGDQYRENGGTLSLATIQDLYNQMVNTGTTEIVYRFGRTTPDANGKNIILLFNDVDVTKLEQLDKFKVVNVCPTDCNPGVDSYLK